MLIVEIYPRCRWPTFLYTHILMKNLSIFNMFIFHDIWRCIFMISNTHSQTNIGGDEECLRFTQSDIVCVIFLLWIIKSTKQKKKTKIFSFSFHTQRTQFQYDVMLLSCKFYFKSNVHTLYNQRRQHLPSRLLIY